MTLGKLIDKMYQLRQDKAELNEKIRRIDVEYDAIEAQVLDRLQEMGVQSSKSAFATATVSETVVPTLKDWDALSDYIVQTGQTFLLERRVSVTAFRDLLQAGEEVPGVESFRKTKLTLRKNR